MALHDAIEAGLQGKNHWQAAPGGARIALDPARIDELSEALQVLANRRRIELLVALQRPLRLAEIALGPSRDDSWGSGERSISRQGVRKHLAELEELGVVTKMQGEAQGADVQYVVNHARLFQVTQSLRELATVKAEVELDDVTASMVLGAAPPDPKGPHLAVVRGIHEGRVFAIPDDLSEAGWTIGRSAASDIRLDYDPYISSQHARLIAKGDRHFLVDLPSNRNRTYLNWRQTASGAIAPLAAGDIIGLGLTLLVYRR